VYDCHSMELAVVIPLPSVIAPRAKEGWIDCKLRSPPLTPFLSRHGECAAYLQKGSRCDGYDPSQKGSDSTCSKKIIYTLSISTYKQESIYDGGGLNNETIRLDSDSCSESKVS
jgi:hypothetical protein